MQKDRAKLSRIKNKSRIRRIHPSTHTHSTCHDGHQRSPQSLLFICGVRPHARDLVVSEHPAPDGSPKKRIRMSPHSDPNTIDARPGVVVQDAPVLRAVPLAPHVFGGSDIEGLGRGLVDARAGMRAWQRAALCCCPRRRCESGRCPPSSGPSSRCLSVQPRRVR